MEVFGKEINLDQCYDFLCCNPSDSVEEIRKKVTYYSDFLEKYNYSLYNFYKHCNFDDSMRISKWKKDNDYHKLFGRLTFDSYLVILLHKLNQKQYTNIIVGLCSYFDCSDAKIKSPFSDNIFENQIEYDLSKDDYIYNLKINQHSSTNAGVYIFTSSLGSIIEIEKEIIQPDEKVKCLELKIYPVYGDLEFFE